MEKEALINLLSFFREKKFSVFLRALRPISLLAPFILMPFILVSCLMEQGSSQRSTAKKLAASSNSNQTQKKNEAGKTSTGSAAQGNGQGQVLPAFPNGAGGEYNNGTPVGGPNTNFTPQSELRHFADPFSGSYKAKITLPKNYSGYLYLAGLNIPALNEKIVSVRFRFGREMEPITIPATISRAEGIIPQTDMQVLILDLRDKPFEDIRLLYDLFDYNEYAAGAEPTSDPMNPNVYCRGLRLEHDPTFEGSSANTACDTVGEACYYSYAKIRDSGLYHPNGLATIPTEPLINLTGSDFSTDGTTEAQISARTSQNLKKCLPDNGRVYYKDLNNYRQMTYVVSAPDIAALGNSILSVGTGTSKLDYVYQGPYRVLNKTSWVFKSTAVLDPLGAKPNGLFGSSLNNTAETGIFSYLFPRAVKLTLREGAQYVGSATPLLTNPATENRELQTMISGGNSLWMDGCNARVMSLNKVTGEGIHSCNVTATIDVITIDQATQQERVLITTTDLKLQLIRPSDKDDFGRETLYESMKVCSSSNTCGTNECCFNERCWSKDLVSQCVEDARTDNNLRIGEICRSDYQCLSLCCNRSSGRCGVHNSFLEPAVFCSKPPGDQCVTKDWCRRDVVRDCRIIKTGVTPQGLVTCALQCYNRLEHGDCINGTCVAPKSPSIPFFDPTRPDCSNAVDPPTTSLE